ncbi:MAG: hypothetical protein JO157_02475 [Acetobacteraceae bacterium]|nr:hypothetical protein [Acetobacteraceae bacterium]
MPRLWLDDLPPVLLGLFFYGSRSSLPRENEPDADGRQQDAGHGTEPQ